MTWGATYLLDGDRVDWCMTLDLLGLTPTLVVPLVGLKVLVPG